jgi:hypothetical protein
VAGHITTETVLPHSPTQFFPKEIQKGKIKIQLEKEDKPEVITGKVWLIDEDNIDTDMIFHNRHLAITNMEEMGQFTFGNLKGWEDYAQKSETGDIVVTGRILVPQFAAAGGGLFYRTEKPGCPGPIVWLHLRAKCHQRGVSGAGYHSLDELNLKNRDRIQIDLQSGKVTNLENGKESTLEPFSEVQMQIYKRGGLLSPV